MEDVNLTAEADELVSLLDHYKTVLKNIEQNKGTVREQIYQKVKGEYLEKIEALRDRIQPLLDRIRENLQALSEQEAEKSGQREEVNIELEELNFRHLVADVDDDDFEKEKSVLTDKLAEIDEEIQSLSKQASEQNALASRMQIGDLTNYANTSREAEEDSTLEEPPPPDTTILEEDQDGQGREEADSEDDGAEEVQEDESESDNAESDFFSKEVEEPTAVAEEEPYGRLRIMEGESIGNVYDLTEKETTIGRDLDNHIQILDPKISRHHFTIIRRKRAYLIQDQDSANGTFLNNRQISETGLADGDQIRIGGTIIQFEIPK